MEILILISALVLVLVGLAGAFVPVVPGPPIAYAGALLYGLTVSDSLSTKFLVVSGAFMVAITILDLLIPVWGTKRFGGSVYGTRGTLVGMVVGIFTAPLGLILGPFFGALIGELLWDGQNHNRALKAAFGSFLGFLTGVFLKIAFALWMAYAIIF